MADKESTPVTKETVIPTSRDNIRSKIFSAKNKNRKSKVIDFMGEDVEVRQPTVKQVQELAKEARKEDSDAVLLSIMEYCYVPGTNDKVFDDADKDNLLGLPVGDWLNNLNKAIEEMTGVDVSAAEKNLDKTV
jgi:hypothetical protein